MNELLITQNDLRVFGGFFQFVKQKNILRFEDFSIVLSGEFNPWIFKFFIEDANSISNLYESKFACVKLPKSIQEFKISQIQFAKKILASDGSTLEIVKKRFTSPFEKNPSIQDFLLRPKKIVFSDKYWKTWINKELEKLRKEKPQQNLSQSFSKMEDFFSESEFFSNRIMRIEGKNEAEYAFKIDESENTDDFLRYAFMKSYNSQVFPTGEKREGCIYFKYPPLCCNFSIKESDFAYFEDVIKDFLESFEEHIENLKIEEEKCEKQILYADNVFRTQSATLQLYKKKIIPLLPNYNVKITEGENYFKIDLGYRDTEIFYVTSENADKIYKYFEQRKGAQPKSGAN